MYRKFLVFVFLLSICSLATADQSHTPSGAEPDSLYAKLTGNQALFLRNFYNGIDGQFGFRNDSVFTEFSDGTATITGCLLDQVHPTNEMCGTLNLSSKHSQPVGNRMPLKQLKSTAYTQNGGPVDVSTWNYYFVGTSDFTGQNTLDGAVIRFTPKKGMPEFQIGIGANGKNIVYGFTGRMKYKVISQPFTSKLYLKGKAEFNVQFAAITPPPPPSTSHIITSMTVPDNNLQSFNFVTTGEGYVLFSLTGGTSNDQEVVAGNYSISTTAVDGRNSLGVCFDNGNFVSPSSIVLEDGETILCRFFSFKNEAPNSTSASHIVVFEETNPNGSNHLFTFKIGSGWLTFQLTDGQRYVSIGLPSTYLPGEHFSVTQFPTQGWTPTAAVCTNDGVNFNIDPDSFPLAANKIVACLFTNTQEPPTEPPPPPVCPHDTDLNYWKKNSNWTVSYLTLGTGTYYQDMLVSILNEPAGSNGLIKLAQQLIVARLNILNGADGSAIQPTLDASDAMIGNLVVPPVFGSINALTLERVEGLVENTLIPFNSGPLACNN